MSPINTTDGAAAAGPSHASDPPVLPPLGQIQPHEHANVVSYVSLLAREAYDARVGWDPVVDDNLQIYTYGTLNPSDDKVVIPEIQNAVITATDIQTKEPPNVRLDPVDSGEPANLYWNGPEEMAQMLGLPPIYTEEWMDEAGDLQPAVPLPTMLGLQLQQSGMLQAEWLVDLNDKLVCDVYQQVFDVYWQRSRIDRRLRSNLLKTNVQGWALDLFEFDDDEQKALIKPLTVKQVYIDPTVEDLEDAAYAIVDLVIDAEEAKKLYPAIADDIDRLSKTGIPSRPDGLMTLGQNYNRDFKRKMLTMRVAWLRNQPLPLGDLGVSPDAGDPGGGQTMRESAETLGADPAAAADERTASAPATPAGPVARVVREIRIIESLVAWDSVCEHWDIPLLHNVCIPIPGKPWGIGEPYRLVSMQEADSRVITALVDHADFYKSPVTVVSSSTYALLAQQYGEDFHIKPGMVFEIDDDVYRAANGQIHTVIQPPPTPPALVDTHTVLLELLTKESGQADVLQGRAQPQIKSGRAIEMLQSAAASQIGFKSQRTGDMVYRLARLMLYCLVHRLTLEDLGRVVGKYPPYLLEAIQRRAQRIEWDVAVTIASGAGGMIAQKKAEAREDFQLGLISLETARDELDYDHRREEDRNTALARQRGGGAMGGPEQPQPGQDQQQQQQPAQAAA